jgi:hypothetical protein
MTDPAADGREPDGLNPNLRRGHDSQYAEHQNGSTPLDTISVQKQGTAVWPVIWAVVVVALVAITVFLMFG